MLEFYSHGYSLQLVWQKDPCPGWQGNRFSRKSGQSVRFGDSTQLLKRPLDPVQERA